MNKTILHLTILIIAFLACCSDSAPKELYGTYIRSVDSGLLYSKFIFYSENKYRFYSSSCLSSNTDSGSFVYKEDTIYFTSFDKERDKKNAETKRKSDRTLTSEKLVLKNNKIIYYRTEIYPTIIFRDTFYWIKETERRGTTGTNSVQAKAR